MESGIHEALLLNRYGQRRRRRRWGLCRCSLRCSGIAVADLVRIKPIVGIQAIKTLQAVFAGVGDATAEVLLALTGKTLVGNGDGML